MDEKIYVDINGQKQYVFIRTKDIKNPIILNLHGGPANPDSFITYEFAKEISTDFTFVSWDQRGCGRTYYKNKELDNRNESATFEQALRDVDALIEYLCERFHKQQVIIMGHSYGSLLGINYVHAHPEKVECYIGIGQMISITDTQEANYNEMLEQMKLNNQRTDTVTVTYNTFKENPTLENLIAFQNLSLRYFMKHLNLKQPNQLKLILFSPDLSWKDMQWIFRMLHMKKHYACNKSLLDYTLSANVHNVGNSFLIPMYFVSGEYDKSCHVDMVKRYCETIKAPAKKMVIMEKCGHSPQIDKPIETSTEIKKLLLS